LAEEELRGAISDQRPRIRLWWLFGSFLLRSGVNEKDTVSFSRTLTVSNSFSVGIKFDKGIIETNVGFIVTHSETRTFQYSAVVSPGKTVHIGYHDWYHVNKFNCHTKYFNIYIGKITITTEYGKGMASQWYKPKIYFFET